MEELNFQSKNEIIVLRKINFEIFEVEFEEQIERVDNFQRKSDLSR